jgi:hypothetical protein
MTGALRHDELDREEKAAREHGDGDELEESATGVGRIGQARRIQRVDPTKQIRDLQGDEEHEERVDREEHRQSGGRAQESAKPLEDWGHRSVRPAAREKEDPSPDPGKGRAEQDACNELADRPFAEVEQVGDRAREDRVRAREQKREHEQEREGEGDSDADRSDAPSGPARERATEVRKRSQEERSPRHDPANHDEAEDDKDVGGPTGERHARERDRGHRDEDERGGNVEEQEHRIDAESGERREDHGGRCDPAIEAIDPRARRPEAIGDREDDERGDAHIEAQRRSVEERLRHEPEKQREREKHRGRVAIDRRQTRRGVIDDVIGHAPIVSVSRAVFV